MDSIDSVDTIKIDPRSVQGGRNRKAWTAAMSFEKQYSRGGKQHSMYDSGSDLMTNIRLENSREAR